MPTSLVYLLFPVASTTCCSLPCMKPLAGLIDTTYQDCSGSDHAFNLDCSKSLGILSSLSSFHRGFQLCGGNISIPSKEVWEVDQSSLRGCFLLSQAIGSSCPVLSALPGKGPPGYQEKGFSSPPLPWTRTFFEWKTYHWAIVLLHTCKLTGEGRQDNKTPTYLANSWYPLLQSYESDSTCTDMPSCFCTLSFGGRTVFEGSYIPKPYFIT